MLSFTGERSEICYLDNQSEGEEKNSLVVVHQEFNERGKHIGFVYSLKQKQHWTKYFRDDDGNNHLIKSHTDFFSWGDLFGLLVMYCGLRYICLLPLEDILLSCVLGKNLRRHQPFDFAVNFTKSIHDPRPVKEQAISNVLSYFLPKFICESMLDTITDDEGNSLRYAPTHTITYKQNQEPISPLIATQLTKSFPSWKRFQKKQTYTHQDFVNISEEEITKDGNLRKFFSIRKGPKFDWMKFEHFFKLSLHACPFALTERISRNSKYPKHSLTRKYASSMPC